jgi:hypothetical protein
VVKENWTYYCVWRSWVEKVQFLGPCLVKSEAGNWWSDNNGRIEPERISFLINPKFAG